MTYQQLSTIYKTYTSGKINNYMSLIYKYRDYYNDNVKFSLNRLNNFKFQVLIKPYDNLKTIIFNVNDNGYKSLGGIVI